MAIDTENKRRSAGSHFSTTVYPIPDTIIDAGDRRQVAWLYRAFVAAKPAVAIIRHTVEFVQTLKVTVGMRQPC